MISIWRGDEMLFVDARLLWTLLENALGEAKKSAVEENVRA